MSSVCSLVESEEEEESCGSVGSEEEEEVPVEWSGSRLPSLGQWEQYTKVDLL